MSKCVMGTNFRACVVQLESCWILTLALWFLCRYVIKYYTLWCAKQDLVRSAQSSLSEIAKFCVHHNSHCYFIEICEISFNKPTDQTRKTWVAFSSSLKSSKKSFGTWLYKVFENMADYGFKSDVGAKIWQIRPIFCLIKLFA